MKFKSVLGGVFTAALLSSATFAADTAKPLPSGKPAGAQKATLLGTDIGLLGTVALATVVVIAVAGGFNSDGGSPGYAPVNTAP